jgi:MFS family permease
MKKNFLRFLNIQESESIKILYFFLFALFIQAGVAVGESVANSMFLINVGVEKLSVIYMVTPFIILFLYIPVYSFFTSRYGEDKFFVYSLAMLIIVNIGIYFFIENAKAILSEQYFSFIYYFLLLYTTVMVITLYTLVWNFIDRFFDIMDSKRVFSIFAAGTAIGAMLGGALVSLVTQYFSANLLLVCWSLFSVIAFLLLMKIPKKFKSIDMQEEDEEELPIIQQLVAMFKNLKSSTYVLVLSALFFISILLATILEYEYMGILSKDQSVESLALMFGQLYVVVNFFNLVVNFFLFNRLVIRYGVKNVLLIQPVAYLLVFAYLSVEVGVEAGILGFFVVQGILVSIDYNNQNLLYNGINSKIKYEVRTFIENLGEPFGIALAGLFLFLVGDSFSISQVAYVASALALLYFIVALVLKYQYPKAMIKNLKDNWLDLARDEKDIIENLPLIERQEALKYESSEEYIMIARFIRSYDAPKAVVILLNFLNKSEENVYIEADTILQEILDSKDPEVMRVVIEWLQNNLATLNISLKKELGSRGLISAHKSLIGLDSEDVTQRCAAAVSIFNSQYPQHFSKAIEAVYRLLHSDNEDNIVEGLYVLSRSKHTQYAFYAAEFLNHRSEKIVVKALETIHKLCDHHVNRLVTPMLEIFERGTKEQRLLSIKILAKIEDTQSIIPLLERIDIVTAYEKREILGMIDGMGLQSIPALVTVLVEKRFSYFARSIAGRSLGRLAFAQFKSLEKQLILDEIEVVYKLLHFYKIVSQEQQNNDNSNLPLLSKYFMDKHQVVLEFILEILSIGGNLPSFELMKTSLRSSNSKSRGNAIETIEQSTDQSIFKELLPLLDRRAIEEVMHFYKNNYEVGEYSLRDIIQYSLNSDSEIESLIAISLMPHFDENYLEYFRNKLQERGSYEIKEALFDGINTQNSEENSNNNSFSIVDKLAQLIQNSQMSYFTVFSLYIMLQNSELTTYKAEDNSECSISGLSILLNGECFIDENSYSIGDFIGFNKIFSKKQEDKKIVNFKNDIEVLTLKQTSLVDTIEIYPETGIGFL